MDKERLPQWGWLLLGLFVAAMGSNLLNALVLHPIGLPFEYFVVVLITAMSLVAIYVNVWYNDDRAEYWERSRLQFAGDIFFVSMGAIIASGFAIAITLEAGLSQIPRELVAMIAGFLTAWLMFYWRNLDLYRDG